MSGKRKKSMAMVAMALALFFPGDGFSEDQSAGFYAGPLSAVAETVVVKSKSVPRKSSGDMPRQEYKGASGSEIRRLAEFQDESPLSSSSGPQPPSS